MIGRKRTADRDGSFQVTYLMTGTQNDRDIFDRSFKQIIGSLSRRL